MKALRLRQLLLALVLVLTFEGISRKAFPALSIPIFFLKDVLVMTMGYYVLRLPRIPAISFLWTAYKVLGVLLVPLILMTAWHDPLLAVFGAKQYLLYPMVGFALFHAFQYEKMEVISTFFFRTACLILPTSMLAFIQLRLPSTHWLNLSVNGESLEAFSAGGHLRVSSTFSFVAQYTTFLNAQFFILMIALQGFSSRRLLSRILLGCLIPLLVLSCFITGSRGAVVGNTTTVLLALLFVMMKFQARNIFRMLFIMGILYIAVLAVSLSSPDVMAGYSQRENGHLIGFSSEVRGRIFNSFFNVGRDKYLQTFFGNGLGIMSNGSETFSNYAAYWRDIVWTESDFSSTLFEGGYYMVIFWYSFRLYIIVVTTTRFLKQVTIVYSVPVAFVQGFVVVIGVLGTLAIQPPVAIWWWLGVGTSLLFWWKSIAPPEMEIQMQPPPTAPPRKLARGRSLYAEVLHPKK